MALPRTERDAETERVGVAAAEIEAVTGDEYDGVGASEGVIVVFPLAELESDADAEAESDARETLAAAVGEIDASTLCVPLGASDGVVEPSALSEDELLSLGVLVPHAPDALALREADAHALSETEVRGDALCRTGDGVEEALDVATDADGGAVAEPSEGDAEDDTAFEFEVPPERDCADDGVGGPLALGMSEALGGALASPEGVEHADTETEAEGTPDGVTTPERDGGTDNEADSHCSAVGDKVALAQTLEVAQAVALPLTEGLPLGGVLAVAPLPLARADVEGEGVELGSAGLADEEGERDAAGDELSECKGEPDCESDASAEADTAAERDGEYESDGELLGEREATGKSD